MAVLTDICGQDVVRDFAGCFGSVVTTKTIAGYIHVIEVRRYPAIGRMARVTGIAAANMVRRFSYRNRIVMAG